MTVAELMVACLEEEGVQYIFGVPGEENEAFLFALNASHITFVPTRHEQGAAFMANVWGRLTGHAGVCLSTLGPGATNLVTGLADASLDKAPVVALTAQGGLDRLHHESHQYLDVVKMFEPIVKWNASITNPDITTEVIRKAFKMATFEKPGVGHIELPEDVATMSVTVDRPIKPQAVRRPGPDKKALQMAVALLAQAKRPLILAGNGAIRKRASECLTHLAQQFNIPVVCTFMGKGAVSDALDQSLMSIGLGFNDYVQEVVNRSDLIVTVGYDIAEYAPESWNANGDKVIVHIDFEPAEVYINYDLSVEVVGDIASTLALVNEKLKKMSVDYNDSTWFEDVRKRIVNDIATYDLQEGDAFTVPGTLNIIRDILDENGLLISDVGSHKMWIARNFPTYCPNGCLISNGLASMGIALPGGIAASLVDPNRQVVAAMGDGGFLMNVQALETAKRLGVGMTAVVFNDDDYGLIRWKQEMARDASISTKISNPNFQMLAKSFGCETYQPKGVPELKRDLGAAIHSSALSLVEVPIVTDVNQKLTNKLEAYWESL